MRVLTGCQHCTDWPRLAISDRYVAELKVETRSPWSQSRCVCSSIRPGWCPLESCRYLRGLGASIFIGGRDTVRVRIKTLARQLPRLSFPDATNSGSLVLAVHCRGGWVYVPSSIVDGTQTHPTATCYTVEAGVGLRSATAR